MLLTVATPAGLVCSSFHKRQRPLTTTASMERTNDICFVNTDGSLALVAGELRATLARSCGDARSLLIETNINAWVRMLNANGARFYPAQFYPFAGTMGIFADVEFGETINLSRDAARPSKAKASKIRLILRGGGCSASKAAATKPSPTTSESAEHLESVDQPVAIPGPASTVAPRKQDDDLSPPLSTPPPQQLSLPTVQLQQQPALGDSKPHPGWERCLGPSLEPPLRSGAIALMDAAYVVKMAEDGRCIAPRQLLPPKAFLSLEVLQAQEIHEEGLRLLCVSYPWLQVRVAFALFGHTGVLIHRASHTLAARQPRPEALQPRHTRERLKSVPCRGRAVGCLLGLCEPLPAPPRPKEDGR